MVADSGAPWDTGDDLALETEDEFAQRTGSNIGKPRVLDLGASGPALQTVDEARRRPARGAGGQNRLVVPLALVLTTVLFWEIGATLQQHYVQPAQPSDWTAAVSRLKKLRGPLDPVLLAPFWVAPIGRMHLAGVLDLELATLSDVDRFRRIWLLSIRGATHPWLAKHHFPKKGWFRKHWEHGKVTLSLYENAFPARVLYDFRQRISMAKVMSAPPERPCPLRGKRFRCGGGRWVGPHLAEVAHRPYRCIYAHPVGGKRLRIDFSGVSLGSRIVGYSGIDDFENRKKAKGAVRLQIFVDGALVGGVLHQNDWPWHRFEADTRKVAGKGRRVRFEITSERPNFRTFCFHAEARR